MPASHAAAWSAILTAILTNVLLGVPSFSKLPSFGISFCCSMTVVQERSQRVSSLVIRFASGLQVGNIDGSFVLFAFAIAYVKHLDIGLKWLNGWWPSPFSLTHYADTPTPTPTREPPCGWHCHRRALGVRTPRHANTEVMNMQQVMEAGRLSASHSSREGIW